MSARWGARRWNRRIGGGIDGVVEEVADGRSEDEGLEVFVEVEAVVRCANCSVHCQDEVRDGTLICVKNANTAGVNSQLGNLDGIFRDGVATKKLGEEGVGCVVDVADEVSVPGQPVLVIE